MIGVTTLLVGILLVTVGIAGIAHGFRENEARDKALGVLIILSSVVMFTLTYFCAGSREECVVKRIILTNTIQNGTSEIQLLEPRKFEECSISTKWYLWPSEKIIYKEIE